MLNEIKFKHSKMDDLIFTDLKIQEYLASESITLEEEKKQAGAELCQAQFKLGLAKTAFPDVDIVFVFVFPVLNIYEKIEVIFHLTNN